ncbi:MAG: type II toxin-antitoxin system RelE/ParE family toxin [Acidobacteria bacterium]|nr:type II toxin-antitoxin system RelE/ParE family toxin [Acidobacteriota bacterium]
MGAYSLTRKAAADIDGIYTYTIEQHGLAMARKYVNGLRACFEHLAEYPMLGRQAEQIAPDVRRHECQSHVVFYVPGDIGVTIVRVLHARMDVSRGV